MRSEWLGPWRSPCLLLWASWTPRPAGGCTGATCLRLQIRLCVSPLPEPGFLVRVQADARLWQGSASAERTAASVTTPLPSDLQAFQIPPTRPASGPFLGPSGV